MLEILKLIRLRTIAFTAFTMYAIRFFVVQPVLEKAGFALQMPEGNFSLLVIAVCCLVSAAYVINDYFDTKADRISGNRPVIVGKTISRRAAIILHSILNVVAVGIAYYLAREAHHAEIVFLFLIISLVLWFYSSRIKKRFIWGNIVVAILAGLIPLTVITFEIPLLSDVYSDVVLKTHVSFAYVFYWTACFSYFLFINMLIYEINKDIYSINGYFTCKIWYSGNEKGDHRVDHDCHYIVDPIFVIRIYTNPDRMDLFCCSFDYTILVLRLCGIEE